MGFHSLGNWCYGGNRYLYHYRNSCSYISRSSPCCFYRNLSYLCFLSLLFAEFASQKFSATGCMYSYLYVVFGRISSLDMGYNHKFMTAVLSVQHLPKPVIFKGLLSHCVNFLPQVSQMGLFYPAVILTSCHLSHTSVTGLVLLNSKQLYVLILILSSLEILPILALFILVGACISSSRTGRTCSIWFWSNLRWKHRGL